MISPHIAKEILANPANDTVKVFVERKALELSALTKCLAEQWLLTIIRTWAGPKIWEHTYNNQKKLDVVYKCWKTSFYGFGLEENADPDVLRAFRKTVRKELDELNDRMNESRRRYLIMTGKLVPEQYSDGKQKDYCNQEAAKLFNERTSKKNIVPAPAASSVGVSVLDTNIPISPVRVPKKEKKPATRIKNPYKKQTPKAKTTPKPYVCHSNALAPRRVSFGNKPTRGSAEDPVCLF